MEGRILRAGILQYMDAFEAYSPDRPFEEPYSFLTLTDAGRTDENAENRRMARGQQKREQTGRNLVVDFLDQMATGNLTLGTLKTVQLIPPYEDGLSGEFVLLGPGGIADIVAPARSAGQYAVVMSGRLLLGPKAAQEAACIYFADGKNVRLKAGAEGAKVLVLRFGVREGASG